jgi:hypothetical protein
MPGSSSDRQPLFLTEPPAVREQRLHELEDEATVGFDPVDEQAFQRSEPGWVRFMWVVETED